MDSEGKVGPQEDISNKDIIPGQWSSKMGGGYDLWVHQYILCVKVVPSSPTHMKQIRSQVHQNKTSTLLDYKNCKNKRYREEDNHYTSRETAWKRTHLSLLDLKECDDK